MGAWYLAKMILCNQHGTIDLIYKKGQLTGVVKLEDGAQRRVMTNGPVLSIAL